MFVNLGHVADVEVVVLARAECDGARAAEPVICSMAGGIFCVGWRP